MSAVGADPEHKKVLDEINQVTLEVAKIESRLEDMGKNGRYTVTATSDVDFFADSASLYPTCYIKVVS